MKDDLIRRQAVVNTVFSMLCRWDTEDPDDLKNMLLVAFQELPAADAVPVIRCKDCKYNRNPPSAGNALCDLFYGMTDQNGFCHFGERRTDG